MIVKTLFQHEGRFCQGEIEVKLLAGIPHLQVVGQPDSHIKESGLRLKSALKSVGLKWPVGHQIVVNLRPSYLRKSSSGADLAIALGFLALTGQLPQVIRSRLEDCFVYGELGLDGRVFAPMDFASALRSAPGLLITGVSDTKIRDGEWLELTSLDSTTLNSILRKFDWGGFWHPPSFTPLEFHPSAVDALLLAQQMNLNVLVAGPQGSGKTTWARALYALSPAPDSGQIAELEEMFGEQALERKWRPWECPHHSITPLAMIGGGVPLFPGVISRAHGGLLVMDEFLQFDSHVLEALREPIENGYVEHARKGDRQRFPANFQLIGTTNLCACGKLAPNYRPDCSRVKCRAVCDRLSGPIMDRFDLLILSHDWVRKAVRIPWLMITNRAHELREFRLKRGSDSQVIPEWVHDLEISHRRRRSLLRVARGLADLRRSPTVEQEDYKEAFQKVVPPMEALRQLSG